MSDTEAALPTDLKDVQDRAIIPDGVYPFEVDGGQIKEGPTDKYANWEMKCLEPKYKGTVVYDITSLSKDALWRLVHLLKALGEKEPSGKRFDMKNYFKRKFMGEIVIDNYTDEKKGGKKGRSNKFVDYFPMDGSATSTPPVEKQQAKAEQKADEDVNFD